MASIVSWKFIYLKIKVLKESEENTNEFEKFFWSGGDLKKLYESLGSSRRGSAGMAEIFRAGYQEYISQKEHGSFDKKSIESVRRAMQAAFNRELDSLDRHLPFLASLGSVSPYIGLFGTVWGIMNAFIGLANVVQATLAQVAPGIAEALIATAMGLFAAIPAVIAYNRFAAKVDRLSLRFESFMEEFINIFMVTAPMTNPGVVELPKVGQALKQTTQPIVVSIKKDGVTEIEGKQYKRDDLLAHIKKQIEKNPDQSIVIAADKKVMYEQVIAVMDLFKQNDVSKVGLLLTPEK